MDKVAALPDRDRQELFEASASELGVHPAIIEKDFWVCWVLKHLFASEVLGSQLVFKLFKDDLQYTYLGDLEDSSLYPSVPRVPWGQLVLLRLVLPLSRPPQEHAHAPPRRPRFSFSEGIA